MPNKNSGDIPNQDTENLEQKELNRKEEKIIVSNEPVSKEFQKDFINCLDNDTNTYYITDYRDQIKKK